MLHLEIHAPPAQNNPLELAVEALRDPQPLLFALGENLLHSTRERFARQESPEGIPWQALSPRYAARKPALVSNRDRGKGQGKSRARGKSGTRGSTARGSTTQGIYRIEESHHARVQDLRREADAAPAPDSSPSVKGPHA